MSVEAGYRHCMTATAAGSGTSRSSRWAASLTARRVALVLALSVLAAIALNPIFVTPFVLVLGRTLFVGMMRKTPY